MCCGLKQNVAWKGDGLWLKITCLPPLFDPANLTHASLYSLKNVRLIRSLKFITCLNSVCRLPLRLPLLLPTLKSLQGYLKNNYIFPFF